MIGLALAIAAGLLLACLWGQRSRGRAAPAAAPGLRGLTKAEAEEWLDQLEAQGRPAAWQLVYREGWGYEIRTLPDRRTPELGFDHGEPSTLA